MELDDDSRWIAMQSRDRRFEGRFVAGVTSTGIYCRPGCPARIPRRENVRFYPCAAAAEEAGFRPCMRCRPETAPGSPAWAGTSATVSRALRLIHAGDADDQGVEALAERLGVGSRHLRRLFAEHVGASPRAVALTRRVHFARRLIEQTHLPMADVAHTTGFASVRRFNDAIRRTFRAAPRELRRGRSAGERGRPGGLALLLPYRPPYDWDALLDFLGARAIPGVEVVRGGTYRRAIRVGDASGHAVVEVAHCPRRSAVELRLAPTAPRELIRVVAGVDRVFDLSCDPAPIAAHLGRDRRLAASVRRRPGLRVPGAWDPFELAVRAVLGQQVSVRGATTLAGRLVERFGEALPADVAGGGVTHLFPAAAALAGADVARVGLPRARAETLRALAAAVAGGALLLDGSRPLEETLAALTAIRGIGPWTAHYVAMRALGEPDAFPAGDLGIARALAGGGERPPPAEVARRAEAWRPWRAYATFHLWAGAPAEESER